MRVVPQLGRKEDLVAGDARLLDRIADRWLGAIDACCVNVAVASLEGVGDCSANDSVAALNIVRNRLTAPEHPYPAKCRSRWLESLRPC